MAHRIVDLLDDADRRKETGREGARWVRERFNRERMIDDYDRYFRSLHRARSGR
jgi:glycosyltransferase involved in cell wall biosynthesis